MMIKNRTTVSLIHVCDTVVFYKNNTLLMSKKKKNKFKKKQFNLREKIGEYVHIVRDIKTNEYSLLYNYSQNKNAKIHSSKSLEEIEMAKEIFINSLIYNIKIR